MNKQLWSGYLVLILLALVVLIPVLSLIFSTGSAETAEVALPFWQSGYLRQILFFSLWQAFLSTLFSVGLAIPVARALAHRGDFPFRSLLLKLFGLPLVVPAVVAVMGVVSVYGNTGWIPLGRSLYGLPGILLAHLFFNLSLGVRLLLPVWSAIPAYHWQLGDQLAFNGWQKWRYIEWPALRESLPSVSVLVFMLCLTSFAVVLTLGGGPRSTTLEVAIFQSLRFDFDPSRAVLLALLQLTLCALVAFVSLKFQLAPELEISLIRQRPGRVLSHSIWHILFIGLAVLFVCLPLLAMLVDAIRGPVIKVLSNSELWKASAFSLLIGLSAATLSVITGWLLLRTSSDLAARGRQTRANFIELGGSMVFVFPPLVLGTGLFVLLAPHVNVFNWAPVIVILINSLMGLPFVIRTLGPAMRQQKTCYSRLCSSLSLSGWNRFKLVDWPLLRKPVGLAGALVAALAIGDLGVIALFGTPETYTLPLMLYHQLAAYLIPDAAVTAIFLLGFCLGVFWFIETIVGGNDHAQD